MVINTIITTSLSDPDPTLVSSGFRDPFCLKWCRTWYPKRKEKKFHVLRGLRSALGFCWSLDPDSEKPGYLLSKMSRPDLNNCFDII